MPHARIAGLSAGFARYAAAVVRHFRGRISHWEIWNEPNIWTFWRPRPNPGDYAQLLTRTYRAIKRVEPRATVIMGGTSGVDVSFLRAVATRTHAFDAIAVHPYRVLPEDRLLRQIAALRAFHRPLWFTEIGWAASNRCPLCTDEQSQAADLVRFYALAAGAGVSHIFWYDLRDDVHVPSNPEGHFGLLRRNLAGKPAFSAFHFLARALARARFVSADALGRSGIYALRFRSAGGIVEVVWNTKHAGSTVSLHWAAPGAALLSLDGNILRTPIPRKGRVRIRLSWTPDPVYLVSLPRSPVPLPGALLWRAHHMKFTRHHRTAHRPARKARSARRTRIRRQGRPRRRAAQIARAARPAPRRPKQGRRRPSPVLERGGKLAPISTPTAAPRPSSTPHPVRPTPTPSPTAGGAALTPTPPVPTATAPAGS